MAIRYVQFRGTRRDVSRIVRLAAGMISGRVADQHDIGKGFLYTLGFAALTDIKDAFLTKARGGTDEMGIRWPKLSPAYLAYGRRFERGEQAQLKRGAGLGGAHRRAPGDKKGLLTAGQLKQWRFLFVTYKNRFMLSEPEKAAASHAAAVAWVIMKKRGAKTKLEVFGNREVDILRDTGAMLNSLSPGILSSSAGSVAYGKPAGDGGEEQIFNTEPGAIIVGTNVAYASSHQRGEGVPQRKFLPDEQTPVPAVWWDRWKTIVTKGLSASLDILFRQAA
jgi:hypothetical protein